MDMSLFWKSLFLGLAIAAPLGPIGALCINRTLERGFVAGVAGGLGTALADAVYAAFTAFGFAALANILIMIDTPLRLIGGALMIWLGWQSMQTKPPRQAAKVSACNLLGTTAATFALTITNPMTILSFAAIFGGIGLVAGAGGLGAFQVVAGVFIGSMLWWSILSGGVTLAQDRLPDTFTTWVSRISGCILIGFGLWAASSIIF